MQKRLNRKINLPFFYPINLKRLMYLIVLFLLLQGCVSQTNYWFNDVSKQPRNWAFFIDLSAEERPFLFISSTPLFIEEIVEILLNKYDYDDDNIYYFDSVDDFRYELHTSEIGLELKNGGLILVYFYRKIESDFLKTYLAKTPTLYDSADAFYPAFSAISDIERISKSDVLAIFDGCKSSLATAFEARIQEFESLFTSRNGKIELISDCDFKEGQIQFRKKFAEGLSSSAVEPSGMTTGVKLAKWMYEGSIAYADNKAEQIQPNIGKSYFFSKQRKSSSSVSDSFQLIPSFSQLIDRITTSDDTESQRLTASLIGKQLNPQTSSKSARIKKKEIEKLWKIVGMNDRDLKSRQILMKALANADEANAVDWLSEYIIDRYELDLRKTATYNLSLIHKPEALVFQMQQVSSENLMIRESAFAALKTWFDGPEISSRLFGQAFSQLSQDKDEPQKVKLVRTLVESVSKQETPGQAFNRNILGKKLLEIIEIGSPDLRREVIFALRDIKFEDAAPKLFEIFLDSKDDDMVRTASAYSIGEITKNLNDYILEQIEQVMKDEAKPSIRASASFLLGKIDNEKARQTLINLALTDPDDIVKISAIDALSGYKNPKVTDALISASEDKNKKVRLMALNALRKQEPTARLIRHLFEITESGLDESTKDLANKLLEEAGGNLSSSIQLLKNVKAPVEEKIKAVESIGALVKANIISKNDLIEVREAVFNLFSESDFNLRTAAILTLEELPDSLIREKASKLLKDPYAVTRATAVRLVKRKNYKENLDTFLKMLTQDDEISVRKEVVEALGEPNFAQENEIRIIEKLETSAIEESDQVFQYYAAASAIRLLAAIGMKITTVKITYEYLELVDKTIFSFQKIFAPNSFYRILSFLTGGRFYGKFVEVSGGKNEDELLKTAVRYYLLAAQSVPQTEILGSYLEAQNFFNSQILFLNANSLILDQDAKYVLQEANFMQRNDIIKSSILVELAELYIQTNRSVEAIKIYEGLVNRLSSSNLDESIIFTKVLLKLSQAYLKAGESSKATDIAIFALTKITSQFQLNSQLLFDEQFQLLNFIDFLSKNNSSVLEKKENLFYYQKLEANLRQLCRAKKAKQENCLRFMATDSTY